MVYASKWSGNSYLFKHDGMWDGQCPYNIGHSNKMKIPDWKSEIMFNKWNKRGSKPKKQSQKPYRLYWRLHPEQLIFIPRRGNYGE